MSRTLVLASASPSRRLLMSRLGVPFDVVVSGADETVDPTWRPRQAVVELASRKATAVLRTSNLPRPVIIGCDTVVEVDGQIFSKPKSVQDARRVLSILRGRAHEILTGVAVIDAASWAVAKGLATASVVMKPYSDDEIESYIQSGEPMNHAGSYAFQGAGRRLVSTYSGAEDAIEGLPIDVVQDLLAELGVSLTEFA